jgi:hypothetical protein
MQKPKGEIHHRERKAEVPAGEPSTIAGTYVMKMVMALWPYRGVMHEYVPGIAQLVPSVHRSPSQV